MAPEHSAVASRGRALGADELQSLIVKTNAHRRGTLANDIKLHREHYTPGKGPGQAGAVLTDLHNHIVCNWRLCIKEADQANERTYNVILLTPVLKLEPCDEFCEFLAYADLRLGTDGIAHAYRSANGPI